MSEWKKQKRIMTDESFGLEERINSKKRKMSGCKTHFPNKRVNMSQLKNVNFPATDTNCGSSFLKPFSTLIKEFQCNTNITKAKLQKKNKVYDSKDVNSSKSKMDKQGKMLKKEIIMQSNKKDDSNSVTKYKDSGMKYIDISRKNEKQKNNLNVYRKKSTVNNHVLPSTMADKEITKGKNELDDSVCRTLFVGNLPMSITRKGLEKMFNSFGPLDSVRLRGAIPGKSHISKKIADITRTYHSGVHSRIGYVVFKNEDDVVKALNLNGSLLENHHIVVDRATPAKTKKLYDDSRSIFIGNLPFDVADETVWSTFTPCGHIEAVRVIRDQSSGVGKGFGYVLFKEMKSKEDALKLNTIEINGRILRIKSINDGNKKKGGIMNNQWNVMKRKALKIKGKQVNSHSRKSVKKIMNKEKRLHEKKLLASKFQKFLLK